MKILDIVFSYNDGRNYVSRGTCRIRSFFNNNKTTVLMTDLGDKNRGQSVTNAVEKIIQSLIDQGYIIPPATFIEHYERRDPADDTFDKVTIKPSIEWRKTTREHVLEMIGHDTNELDERSLENSRIINQVDKLLFQQNPFVDSIFPASNEKTKRKLEIIRGMISKQSIENLIHNGSGEQEIQRHLKSDLSILGEAYAKPDDEYICFSEFPLADGSIDFVVLTGRSRMDKSFIRTDF